MSRFARIALVLWPQRSRSRRSRLCHLFASAPAGPAAEASVPTDDVTLTTGPLPPPLVENYI
jgi:hypothetical protein